VCGRCAGTTDWATGGRGADEIRNHQTSPTTLIRNKELKIYNKDMRTKMGFGLRANYLRYSTPKSPIFCFLVPGHLLPSVFGSLTGPLWGCPAPSIRWTGRQLRGAWRESLGAVSTVGRKTRGVPVTSPCLLLLQSQPVPMSPLSRCHRRGVREVCGLLS